ncbi:MAG TPA: NAD(P)-dependent oxidoreductase [Usitatibacter sp.]|nr:NAD(P)-dependent oxidoreductase [Usitatibacter sp.]
MAAVRVGIAGVGAMGLGIAKAMLSRGLEVHVRDLVAERERAAFAAGAKPLDGPVDVLVSVVVDADETRAVVREHSHVAPAFMMCSTIAPSDSESIAADLAARGVAMLDAPISGGPGRAHSGTLSMMAAGSGDAFSRCKPVYEAFTARCFRLGSRAGDGSRMKIVNNMAAAANLAAGAEALALASKLGLDLRQVADVVQVSSGASWMFGEHMPRVLERDYAPRAAARVLVKDVGLFVDAAAAFGIEPPMALAALEAFRDTVARGYAEEDLAAVVKRYGELWDVEVPR